MGVTSIDAYLSIFLLIIAAMALATVAFRYYRDRIGVFWDASTYFILLMCLYIIVPSIVHLGAGVTVSGAAYETIQMSAMYSLYFCFVLTLYYLIKTILLLNNWSGRPSCNTRNVTLVPISNQVLYVLYAIIATYIIAVFILNSPGISELWTNRAAASSFTGSLNNSYKIQFLFAVTVSIIVYLVFKNGRIHYIGMFAPFVVMDLVTTDRDYLYQVLIASVGLMLLARVKIPVVKFSAFALFIISIEILRVIWKRAFEVDELLFVPGELLYTKEAEYLIIESQMSIRFLDLLLYSLGKIFTPQAMTALFGGIPHFRDIVTAESQLHFGLGGSMLSEVFGFKSRILYVVYPFITIAYLESINAIRRRGGFFGIFVFIFYLISTHVLFRSGLVFASMVPIYYAMYAAIWYWVIRIVFSGYVRHYSHY